MPSLLSPGLLRSFFANIRLSWRLIREPRVPMYVKALPIAAVAYLVSPLDFIPDVLPFIGEVDDILLLILAMQLFQRMAPTSVLEHHRAAIASRRPFAPMSPT